MPRNLALIFLVLVLSSCSVSVPKDTKLLLSIEERIFSEDKIVTYQIFENGLIEKQISHDSSNPEELYKTSYNKLDKVNITKLTEEVQSLKELDYHNDFPWKEDFTKRATVYKFKFLKEVKTQAFNEADSKTVLVPTVNYFYSGLQEEPKIFTKIIDTVTKL